MAHLVNVPRLVRSNLSFIGFSSRRESGLNLSQGFFSETSYVLPDIVKSVELLTSVSFGRKVENAEPVIVVTEGEICAKPSQKGDHGDKKEEAKQSMGSKSDEMVKKPLRLVRAFKSLCIFGTESEDERELAERERIAARSKKLQLKCQKMRQKREEKERKAKEKEQLKQLLIQEKEEKQQQKERELEAKKQWKLLEERKKKPYVQPTVEPIIGDDEDYVNEKVDLRTKEKETYPEHMFSIRKTTEPLCDKNGEFFVSAKDQVEAGCSSHTETTFYEDLVHESACGSSSSNTSAFQHLDSVHYDCCLAGGSGTSY